MKLINLEEIVPSLHVNYIPHWVIIWCFNSNKVHKMITSPLSNLVKTRYISFIINSLSIFWDTGMVKAPCTHSIRFCYKQEKESKNINFYLSLLQKHRDSEKQSYGVLVSRHFVSCFRREFFLFTTKLVWNHVTLALK